MKKSKFLKTLLAAGLAVTTLAACSGGANSSSNATTTAPQAQSEEKADKSQELVIYSNSVSNGRGDWLTAKAKEAGFNIRMVDIAGAQLADRVIAEKNNSVADMVFGIGAVDSNKLRDANLLAQFKPEWLNKIDASLADKDGFYFFLQAIKYDDLPNNIKKIIKIFILDLMLISNQQWKLRKY